MRPDDPRESSEASSFIWKHLWEAFVVREPKVDLISTEEFLTTQQQDHETLRILAAKSEGKAAYQDLQIND